MRTTLRAILTSATLAAGLLIATSAWAGGPGPEEIWFGTGADSLETDENNSVTSEGAKTKTAEVDRIPGEEDWEVRIVAKLNGYAGTGPLYIEFFQEVQGAEHKVWHHEEPDYDGNRNLAITTVLEGNHGFNKNREYRVQIVQNNGKRDIVLAKGKIKLIDTGRKGPEEADEGEDEDEVSKQDEIDTLAGGDEDDEGGDDEGKEGPPAIDDTPTKKKGCAVVDDDAVGFSGVLLLLGLGAFTRRRRS